MELDLKREQSAQIKEQRTTKEGKGGWSRKGAKWHSLEKLLL